MSSAALHRLSEHDEQVLVARWLDWRGELYFAVPNAARRSFSLATHLRAEGMKTGVPDLWLPLRRVVIEMKAIGGKPTPEQTKWIERLREGGWKARVCHGHDEAIGWLKEILGER